ncbi:13179_t:CDS:2 [Acaulospora colombiana]|uniref:13179_t:CDS:1 n=1 Tax=Acaulospora colombiana TaxID=27376 RepID=A0ACA9L0Z1_9GLOM|nr:13179_t:CDS:2 [Acaulospora colombiana]
MGSLRGEYHLNPGDLFMVVDCGGGTVDLTVRELLEDDQLSEITERTGDCCGSCFVDKAYIEFLGNKMGESAIDTLKRDYYRYLQQMVLDFCKNVKIPFTGREEDFNPPEIDLEDYGTIRQYVDEEKKDSLEKDEWLIKFSFEDVKHMFDPVIGRIIRLVKDQLEQLERSEKEISLILLVGGFSESKYLQNRIREEFLSVVPNISVPIHPIIAVMKGAVRLGLSEEIVKNRVLRWTYGTDVMRKWTPTDPPSQRLPNGYIKVFEKLVERGKQVRLNECVMKRFKPHSLSQEKINMDMYITSSKDSKYFNDPEIRLLRRWEVKLDESERNATFLFTFKFCHVGISATAKNEKTGKTKAMSFRYDLE